MEMRFQPEVTVEMAVVQLQSDLAELKTSNDELRKFIVGNGDPKKGLLWLAANQGELLIALGGLITAQAKALEHHTLTGHMPKQTPLLSWLGREAMRQVVVSVVIVMVALLALGIVTYVRSGGRV